MIGSQRASRQSCYTLHLAIEVESPPQTANTSIESRPARGHLFQIIKGGAVILDDETGLPRRRIFIAPVVQDETKEVDSRATHW